MGKKKNKKSSTATGVETAHVPFRKSLKNGSKGNLKKQKSKETKELTKSMKELTEVIKKQQEILLTKADPREEKDGCGYYCEDTDGNDTETLYVGGVGVLGSRYEIKKALRIIFSQCGVITRIFAPYECATGVPLGYAFLNLRDARHNVKALEFNNSTYEGRKLEVVLATRKSEFYGYTDFRGCQSCDDKIQARLDEIYARNDSD